MNFMSPERLWLLAGVGAMAAAYVVLQARRKTYALKFTNLELLGSIAPKRPGWRRHIPAFLFLIALSTLVLGFARPTADERVPRERATIILAIDTSLSMEATDVAPNRIDAAKAAAASFADILPPRINLGLVSFNGNAILKVPPTTDRARVKKAISELKLDQATAIGESIFASIDAVNSVPADAEGSPPAHIVVMSDGATTAGRPNEVAAKAAKDAGIPVSTIAFGTDNGTIKMQNDPRPVPVKVDRKALEEIATATDGTFFEAAAEGQLKQVYDNIGSQIGYTTEQREISALFIGGALAVLVVSSALSLAWFSRLP